MKVIRRDPDKGYLDTSLWVPKRKVNAEGVKTALTFTVVDRTSLHKFELWKETAHFLILPREFWNPEELDFPVIDCRVKTFQHVNLTSRIKLDHLPDEHNVLQPTGKTVQLEALQALLGARGGILQLACGKGKAQPLATRIPTPDGWRVLGALKVGNEVIGSTGTPIKVVGVFPQGKRPIYRVTMEDGTSTRCSEEHLWFTQTPGDRRKGLPGQVRTLGEIKKTLQTKAGAQHAIPRTAAIQYASRAPVFEPWLIGFYLGDGHSAVYSGARRIQFDKGASAPHEYIARTLAAYDIETTLRDDGRSKNRTTIVNFHKGKENALWETLYRQGLIGVLGPEKYIPEEYFQASITERWGLMEGLLDADGSRVPTGRTFSTTSPRLRDGLVEIARSLGIRVTVEERQTYYTHNNEKRAGRPSWRLYMTHEKWGTGRYTKQYIQSIEPEGEEECVCIKVDAEDELYVTENFILTHNTVIFLEYVARVQVPTLIVIDNTQLLEQWKKEIALHLEVPGGVGLIQGKEFDWKKSIVLTTYQTLANLAETFPEDARRWFGLVGWDEGHHIAAPTFCRSADLFYGKRIALTATPDREDGMQVVYHHHVGKVLYKDLKQELRPRIYFKWTGLALDKTDPVSRGLTEDKNGELHVGKIAGYLGQWQARLTLILDLVTDALAEGRKVLVLSNSIDELVNLKALWDQQPLYTDIKFPLPSEIGETLIPIELQTVDVARITRHLWAYRGQISDPKLPMAKKNEIDRRIKESETTLAQHEVWKKLDTLQRKRQRDYVKSLVAMTSTAGLMIHEVPAKIRARLMKEKEVVFAVSKYGREGLDSPDLDTIIAAEPMSSRNALQQFMGRVLRKKAGKQSPVVVFLEDDIGPMIGMCQNLRRHLREWPVEEAGPYEYENVGHPASFTKRGKQWTQNVKVFGR